IYFQFYAYRQQIFQRQSAARRIDHTMNETLSRYLPQQAVKPVFDLIVMHQVHLKIVNQRSTRHGDYRQAHTGKHEITVNGSLNKYRFLMTLIHEISHLIAFEKFGRAIKPHGQEWKHT